MLPYIYICFYLSPCLLLLLLHSVGSANKTFYDNDKFLLFYFRYTLVRSALTLDKPKYRSPIFRKQHAASHYTTTSHNDPLHCPPPPASQTNYSSRLIVIYNNNKHRCLNCSSVPKTNILTSCSPRYDNLV